MINLFSKFLTFHNIQEITFTKVENDIFTMKVKSDIVVNDNKLDNCEFEAKLCVIDSTFSLNLQNEEYTYNDGLFATRSQTFEIPLNIRMLLDKELKEYFTIKHGLGKD